MEKFKNVVDANVGIGNVINGLILGNMESDYNEYKIGDRVSYEFWLDEDFEDYNDDCNINEIKEFVGEGVSIVRVCCTQSSNRGIGCSILRNRVRC